MNRAILSALSLFLIPLSSAVRLEAAPNEEAPLDAAAIDGQIRRIDETIAAVSRAGAGAVEDIIAASLGHGVSPDASAKELVPLLLRKMKGHQEHIKAVEKDLAQIRQTQKSLPEEIRALGEALEARLHARKRLHQALVAEARQSLIYLRSDLGAETVLEKKLAVLEARKSLLLIEKKFLPNQDPGTP